MVVSASQLSPVKKSPTGIKGLDEITFGGLPTGRSTLICGGPGCGKTLMGVEFLVRGAVDYKEPGVFLAFEEKTEDLATNVASLGLDLGDLIQRKLLVADHVQVERSEIEETGSYDLEGLFVRLDYAIKSIGAKRVVLDTLDSIFSSFENETILRSELRRLFNWLTDKGVTVICTGERGGEGTLTRQGLEEYVSDCVIVLDHRVDSQVSTRRLRVLKYRGSVHGTNEYPFLIDDKGISVLPISSLSLNHSAPQDRVSTGIEKLDQMMGGKGYFRGSTILVSGTAGAGKTSMAAHFIDAACRRGERCLYFSFEESQQQVTRNMRSIGLDLAPWIEKGLLHYHASRPTVYGLEMHLVKIHKIIRDIRPTVIVIDPVTNLISIGTENEIRSMLTRIIDFLKSQEITAFFTSLTADTSLEESNTNISSLIDTWLLLREVELGNERKRALFVLKSRGMRHSRQIRPYEITDSGLRIMDEVLNAGEVAAKSASNNNHR